MSRWRPTIGWSLFTLFLATFAATEYWWCRSLPPSPRFSVQMSNDHEQRYVYPVMTFHSPATNKIALMPIQERFDPINFAGGFGAFHTHAGPLYLLDKSSRSLTKHFSAKDGFVSPSFSHDGRYFSAVLMRPEDKDDKNWSVHLVDLKTGAKKRQNAPVNHVQFLKNHPWLLCDRPLQENEPPQTFALPGLEPSPKLRERDPLNTRWWERPTPNRDESIVLAAARFPGNPLVLHRWRLPGWEEMRPMPSIETYQLLPDGKSLVASIREKDGTWKGGWGVWELDGEKPSWTFRSELCSSRHITVSPDGRWLVLACTSKAGDVRAWCSEVWDLQEKRRVGTIPRGVEDMLAFSPDSKAIAAYPTENESRSLFELPSLKERWRIKPNDQLRRGELFFTPSGKEVVSWDYESAFNLWRNQEEWGPRKGFVPAQTKVVAVRWYDAATGKQTEAKSYVEGEHGFWSPRYPNLSPDRRLLLSAPLRVTPWALGGRKIAKTLWQQCKELFQSPERIWDPIRVTDLETHEDIFRLDDPSVLTASFSNDGKFLTSTHVQAGGTIVAHVWDLPMRVSLLQTLAPMLLFVPAGMIAAWWWRFRSV